jgi:hypothetical protein
MINNRRVIRTRTEINNKNTIKSDAFLSEILRARIFFTGINTTAIVTANTDASMTGRNAIPADMNIKPQKKRMAIDTLS